MVEISFFDRIKTIFEMIFSSPFFISLFIILVLTITILLINTKIESKIPKYCAVGAYVVITVFVLWKYGTYVLSINDSIVERFFSALYFPNMVVYFAMLIITLLLLTITFINKNFSRLIKICNIACFSFIWLLFILFLDVIKTNGINVYDQVTIYSNQTLMILLQASMCMFFVWLGVLLMHFLVKKISEKMDLKDLTRPISASIISSGKEEEIRDYTDEEFNYNYINEQKRKEQKKYQEIWYYKD